MKNRIRLSLFLSLTIFMLITSMVNQHPIKTTTALEWDPIKWTLCEIPDGKEVLKAGTTDWVPFLLYGKSVIGSQDVTQFHLHNSILSVSGYTFSKDGKNPFEKFGLRGLKFSSYRGEFKYYDVDPCRSDDRQTARTSNFGQFYETRKEPLTSYSEMTSSKDIRTKTFSAGFGPAFGKSLSDAVSNTTLEFSKFIVTILLALMSLTFSDISSVLGLDATVQESIITDLYSNFFLPLVTTMILFTAIYIAYHGLIKRDFRTAVVGGMLKVMISFILAIFIGINPSLASVPNKVVTLAQSVVISAVSGSISEDDETSLCAETNFGPFGDVTSDDYLTNATNGVKSLLGCKVWSEFLFRPTIRSQFGVEYEELNILENENTSWVGEPIVSMNGKSALNWGLFYVSVMSGEHESLDGMKSPLVGGVHKDYYRIIDALSNYNEKEVAVPVDEGAGILEGRNTYIEVDDTDPLSYWEFFVGNKNSGRLGHTFINFLLVIVGTVAPLVFAMAGAVLGIGITILTVISPVFLLLGCWGGKGNTLMMSYFGTLLSTMFKKVITTFLLMTSVLLMTTAMRMINSVGAVHTLAVFTIMTIVLVKNKDRMIEKFARINVGNLNVRFVGEAISKSKKASKTVGEVALAGAVGGVAAKKSGGTFAGGMASGASHTIQNKMYMSEWGRRAMTVYESNRKDKKNSISHCCSCHVELKEDSLVYVDGDNNYFCVDCASASAYEGMSEVFKDNTEDDEIKMSTERDVVEVMSTTPNINGDYRKEVSYLTFREMSNLGFRQNLRDTESDNKLVTNAEFIRGRIQDGRDILAHDLEQFKTNEKGKIVDGKMSSPYIPEPIRGLVNPHNVRKAVRQGNLREYEQLILTGWNRLERNLDIRLEEIKEN